MNKEQLYKRQGELLKALIQIQNGNEMQIRMQQIQSEMEEIEQQVAKLEAESPKSEAPTA